MQSQQSSARNRSHYNKSIRADRAVTKITPIQSASIHTNQRHKYIFFSNEGGLWILFLPAKPTTKTLANNFCNSYDLRIIMNSPRGFSWLRVFMENFCVSFLYRALFYLTYTPLSNLACGVNLPSNCSWWKIFTTLHNATSRIYKHSRVDAPHEYHQSSLFLPHWTSFMGSTHQSKRLGSCCQWSHLWA